MYTYVATYIAKHNKMCEIARLIIYIPQPHQSNQRMYVVTVVTSCLPDTCLQPPSTLTNSIPYITTSKEHVTALVPPHWGTYKEESSGGTVCKMHTQWHPMNERSLFTWTRLSFAFLMMSLTPVHSLIPLAWEWPTENGGRSWWTS